MDSNHAHDVAMRRSITGFIPIVNLIPVTWVSKWQGMIEGSTHGAEFVALQMADGRTPVQIEDAWSQSQRSKLHVH